MISPPPSGDHEQQDGKDLALFAGGKAATTAVGLDVVDEFRLIVNPALLGGGTRLFDGHYPRQAFRGDGPDDSLGALIVSADIDEFDVLPPQPDA